MRSATLTRYFMWLGFGVVIVADAGGAAPEANARANVKDLHWMAGSWIERKDGVETEEYWTTAKGDMMLGVNRTVRPGGRTSFEFMRIGQTAGGLVYFASPGGRPPVEFALVESGKDKAVFENLKRDYPQRITYWLDDGKLAARIDGQKGNRKLHEEWKWDRAKD